LLGAVAAVLQPRRRVSILMRRVLSNRLAHDIVRVARAVPPPPSPPTPRSPVVRSSRTILGATVGVTVGSVTGTLVMWPIADILLGPWCIKEALLCTMQPAADTSDADAAGLRKMVGSVDDSPAHGLCVLTGGTREQRQALAHEASLGRPTLRLSLRQATAPHAMFMAVSDSLFKPLFFAPLCSCLATVWLTLFDMLITDHDHSRHRDLCVVLSQTRRALAMVAEQAPRRPLIIVEHLFVPMDAEAERGGEGLSPMLRTLRQWLCAVSIDSSLVDVLVLTPTGSAAGDAALAAWRPGRSEARRSCASRLTMGGGVVAIALTQSEAVDRWLRGCRLQRDADDDVTRRRLW